MELFFILIGATLINNYVLVQFLGMCPFFGVSKKTETALGMGLSVMFVMTLASAITFLFYVYVLKPLKIEYLQTVSFILIIASIVQFIEVFMKKMFKVLYSMLGVYLPLITVNCAIFGVTLINIQKKYSLENYSFLESIVNSIGAGAGFTLAMLLLAGIREKYDNNPDVPEVFKGFPLALFSAGLMSIAFMGFMGLI
ncbi:MAG: RnfABCDGE type electron transport complex subunit A [Treponema sp.]|nr:RnfABCDGE type electron transport complex subunit A [Treponema sp.]MCL2237680.1 RnfABCDGE type electron transport complex subunit A [Treponema sp.]